MASNPLANDPDFAAYFDGINIEVVVSGDAHNLHPWDARELHIALGEALSNHVKEFDKKHG